MTTVADLMATALITMKASDTIGKADEDMRLAQIRHIPVVDDRGKLVGIVSNRDILRALRRGNANKVRIAEIMTPDPQTVSEHAPAHYATELMIEYKIGAVPVVSEDGHLVGIVTETDFLLVADKALRSNAV